jgi:hypothetical protein
VRLGGRELQAARRNAKRSADARGTMENACRLDDCSTQHSSSYRMGACAIGIISHRSFVYIVPKHLQETDSDVSLDPRGNVDVDIKVQLDVNLQASLNVLVEIVQTESRVCILIVRVIGRAWCSTLCLPR